MKLSIVQREVLTKLANGWEIGKASGGGAWLQEGGAGRGGYVARVSLSTFIALLRRGCIAGEDRFPTARYNLTPAGRDALEAAKP